MGEIIRFKAGDVCKITGVSYRMLDYWIKEKLIEPEIKDVPGRGNHREFSFSNILEIRVIKRLRDRGISLQKVKRAVETLRSQWRRPLKELLLVTDGSTIFAVVDRTTVLDALRGGQAVFAIFLDDILEETYGKVCGWLGRNVPVDELLDDVAA